MKGTEKQIAWAEDLKSKAMDTLNWAKENAPTTKPEEIEMWKNLVSNMANQINSIDYAGNVIELLKLVNFSGTPDKATMSLVSTIKRYGKYYIK